MKKILLLLLFPLIIYAGNGLEYTISGFFGYRSLNAKIGKQESSVNHTQIGLKSSVLIDETKEVYFGASYGKMSFGDELTFSALPISVATRFSKPSFSIFAGAFLEPYSFSEDFALVFNPEISYSVSSHSWDVSQGPYLEGKVDGKIYFIEARLGVLMMYEGNDNFEPYVGFYFDYFRGTVKFKESFDDLTGVQEDTLKPKIPVMLLVGANFYYGENLSAGISAGLINGLTFTGQIGFTF